MQDADGKQSAVEFIEAPEAAPVGERIGLEGLEMVDAISPAQVKKQKVWEEMVTKVRPCRAVLVPQSRRRAGRPLPRRVCCGLLFPAVLTLRDQCSVYSLRCLRTRSRCSTARR
jgi:hypothetical protein